MSIIGLGPGRLTAGPEVGRGVVCDDTLLIKLNDPRTFTRGRGTRAPRGPGVVFVVYSSVKCKSLKYCKRPCVDAPGVSGVTHRNVHFARTCTKDPIDTPSHTSLVAKRRAKRYRIHNGGRC